MRVLDAGRWMLSTDRVDCHPLSTMTRDSFHVYSWTFRSFVLILFHAYERSHMLCAVRYNFRITKNSAVTLENILKKFENIQINFRKTVQYILR